MKTYKEMAENVLRRRDEYEEKKEHRYGVVKRTAAIAVTVVFVLSAMIVGPIVGRIMKEQQNQPADGTKINTDTETTADQDTETTETADVTTEVGETTGETDISEKYIILKKAEEKHSPDITNGLNIELKDIIEESEKQSFNINDGDMIGVLHSDVCRYELQMSEDYNEDYEKWVVLILPDDNIEMVSPKERYFYHENDKTEKYQSVNIEFRYKAGKTNGSISVYMFAGDYGIKRFEDNFKGVENPTISTSNSLYDVMETYYFAQVKGYDCWSISCTYIYQQAAIYFGDVDDNGVPLYMKNPYLEDYYDNPWCEEKRDEESNKNEMRGVLNNVPQYSVYENEIYNIDRGTIYISVSGTIRWSDKNGTFHPAQHIKIAILDNNDQEIISTLTNDMGHYLLENSFYYTGNLNVKILAYSMGTGANVCDALNSETIYKEIASYNNIPNFFMSIDSYDSVTGNYWTDNDKFNRALSLHQSLDLAYRFAYQYVDNNIGTVQAYISSTDNRTYQSEIDNSLHIYAKDAYDWDVTEHEYGHYIACQKNLIGNMSGSRNHSYHEDLTNRHELDSNGNQTSQIYGKEKAIKLAWSEGFATFFSIYAQLYMNAQNLSIPNVGDTLYTDTENRTMSFNIETLENIARPDKIIYRGETNETTVAGILLDFHDNTNSIDCDLIDFNDEVIWNIINGNTCQMFTTFIQKVSISNFTFYEKSNIGNTLEWFNISPSNVTLTTGTQNSKIISWTNPNNNYLNTVKLYDIYGNLLWSSNTIFFSETLTINSTDWNSYLNGHAIIFIVVDGIHNIYPMTGIYSTKYNSFAV